MATKIQSDKLVIDTENLNSNKQPIPHFMKKEGVYQIYSYHEENNDQVKYVIEVAVGGVPNYLMFETIEKLIEYLRVYKTVLDFLNSDFI